MPPKRASTRRAGSTARVDGYDTRSFIPGISSPETNNPALPSIPTKVSHAYGSPGTPVLPRQLAPNPKMGLTEMAESIDQGIKVAQSRDQNTRDESSNTNDRPHLNTRSRRRSVSASLSPVRRRNKREPTPDQVQLLDSLREVTVSPQPRSRENHSQPERSTATPTPPVLHALSTESSPTLQYPSLPIQQLYPSPLLRFGSPTHKDTTLRSSPLRAGSVDNESVISWIVERDIHDDELQRKRPGQYREEPQGQNLLTAPPRRFSGLAFAHETIEEEEEEEEEEEPISELSRSKSRSREPTVESQLQPRPQEVSNAEPQEKPQKVPEQAPERSSAPARTIIPHYFAQDSSTHDTTPPLSEHSFKDEAWSMPTSRVPIFSFGFQAAQAVRIAAVIIVTTMSLFTIYSFSDNLAVLPHDISSYLPFGKQAPYIPLNSSGLEAVNSLNSQVMRLGAQVTSLSREVNVIRSDVDNVAVAVPAPTTIIQSLPVHQEPPKTNFLSYGMGVLIDPYDTSPTSGTRQTKFQRLVSYLMPSQGRYPQPPLAALTRWDDVGDCWCSTPRAGMSQLSIHLGRQIVPEEVVVEHIPKGASITPGTAPQEMELWARFKVNAGDSAHVPSKKGSSWAPSFLSSQSQDSLERHGTSMSSEHLSLHDAIMENVRLAYRNEPDSAFSDDELLGPSFYRIGQWKYDLDGPDHVQKFSLDVIIDSPEIRVDKVVFRVKSNWGANVTCLYRLKLYGHL